MKKVLLLYCGYPRISHRYQHDEAVELNKKYKIMIISYNWPILTLQDNALPYIQGNPLKLIKEIKNFKPDHIHAHYLCEINLCNKLSKYFNIPFTVRTHSFDILEINLTQYKDIINSNNCKGIIAFPGFKKLLVDAGINEYKVIYSYPSFYIYNFKLDLPNDKHIMSGGSLLPKKNIEGFILLAKKIKNIYPDKAIHYYSVVEDLEYFKKIIKFNNDNGNPVIFKTGQYDMPLEYKKHEWLIYTACDKIKKVGYPLMVAEAQAAGVGVILYNLRDDLLDYVTENGYLFNTDEEVIKILEKPFCEKKKNNLYNILNRYDISNSISIFD
jgi:hypothetical protein